IQFNTALPGVPDVDRDAVGRTSRHVTPARHPDGGARRHHPAVFGSKTQIIWRLITRLHAGVPVTMACGGFHGPAMKYRTPPSVGVRLAAFGHWRLKSKPALIRSTIIRFELIGHLRAAFCLKLTTISEWQSYL
ncbi:MAG: hypothetical protein WA615_30350, partial [Bradyrhizobium sp.]|uniref:hypothetical protein n=1 Tax=Bradyrhizobium sp. TaxID=376 RepID=UPI003C797F67